MYITPYILKAEKGMGELLKQAAKELELRKYETTTHQAWIAVFLTNREVSAQEAVYRMLLMALRRCSRSFCISRY